MKPVHAVRLPENRLSLVEDLPVFEVGGTLDAHRFDETSRRGFQRDIIQRLGQSGFQDDGPCCFGVNET